MAKQSKGRKVGRCLRKPSHKHYTTSRRWILNKARRIVRMLRKHPAYAIPASASDELRFKVTELTKGRK